MLNALVRWNDPAGLPAGHTAFRLDRGRIIVCKGETGRRHFESLWKSGGEAAGGRLIEMKRGLPALPVGEALFIRIPAGREAAAFMTVLEPLLEAHARDGGGALLALADELAPPAITQAIFPAPPWDSQSPRLIDDQGQALRYARQGDWVQLYWPLPDGSLADAETLVLRCSRGGDEWLSAPQPVAAWRPFTAGARALVAELAIPWPPGSYRLWLELSGGVNDPTRRLPVLTLLVKATTVNPLPHEFSPAWRLLGARPVPASLAGLSLLHDAVSELDLSITAGDSLRGEWHLAEPRADGGWRRWIGSLAQWSLAGPGELRMDVEDHRVRGADGAPTQLTLCLDGQRHRQWSLDREGAHHLRASWPDDGFSHLATLSVHPVWTPADFGPSDDHRRLGVLINRCGLSNE